MSPVNKVTTIRPSVRTIEAPPQLTHHTAWLIWRYEHHDGEAKPRKVPYYADGRKRHGTQGGPEDRAALVTFEAARSAASRRNFDGVGFATLTEFGIVALDFDNCISEAGIDPEVDALIQGTYAEFSPSGKGVRAFMLGNLGNSKAMSGPGLYGFETFSTKGFVTFTGNAIDLAGDDKIIPATAPVMALCAKRFGQRFGQRNAAPDADPLMTYSPPIGLTEDQIVEALDVLEPDMGHNQWLHVGMAIHHETGGEGFEAWNEWSAKGGKYPGVDVLSKRWESFGRQTGAAVTARYLIKLAHANGAHIAEAVSTEVFTEAAPPNKPQRYQVVPAGEFSRGERPGWVIKGVIPRAELVVLFGESGAGKSFVALDLAAAITRGIDWRGHRTKAGRVVYLAAEGGGGFRNRLSAYQIHHSIELDELPLGIVHAAPSFLQKADVLDVARAIGKCDVLVIDTFAQVTAGANENAAEDIGKALAHCRGLHRATGAVVVLVHHAGKDLSKGARGWSGLRAAADAEIEVSRYPSGRVLRVSKQKDGEDGREYGFDLEVVNIGFDEDGDVIDSCVVRDADVPLSSRNVKDKKPHGVWERLILEVVAEFSLAQTEVDAVIAEVVRRGPEHVGSGRDQRKSNAKKALRRLADADDSGFFIENDCISVC